MHRKITLVVLAAIATIALSACPASVNPVAKAQTVEQKAYASYGTLTIFAERGAALIADPTLSDSIKKPVAQAIVAVKPSADAAMETLVKVTSIKAEVAAGADKDEQLLIAASELDRYYLELEPLVGNLVKAVTAGYRCRSYTGQELTACLGGGQ